MTSMERATGDNVPRVVFVGAATLDSIALVSAFPAPDERRLADQITFAGGGPAATAAVAASRLGVPTALVGAVGDDAEAGLIMDGLRAEGVDVKGVAMAPGTRSGASVVVVDRMRGTRAICTRPLPRLDVSIGADLILRADWVHVDHWGWAPVRELLDGLNPGARPRISVDVAYPPDGFTPAGADLYVPPVEALRRAYGDLPVDQLLDAARAGGARAVVGTRGADGCVAVTADGDHVSAPGVKIADNVSTLGAGDVFHGALLAASATGMPLPDAMAYANVAAALSCRGLDGRSMIPKHDDVLAHLER